MVENGADFFWEVDALGRYTFAGPQINTLLGYTPEEVVGKTPFDLMPPGEAARVRVLFEQLAATNAPIVQLLNRNVHRDGREIYLETSAEPMFDADGRLTGYRGMDREVTARVRAAEKLREWEEIFQALGHPVMLIDKEFNILAANRFLLKLLKITEDELGGRKCYHVFHNSAAFEPPAHCPAKKLLETGGTETMEMDVEELGKTYLVSCSPLRDENGEFRKIIHIATDVTEQRRAERERLRLEAELQHAKKLESLGALAGGIAHDFNNILQAILGNADVLLLDQAPDSVAAHYLKDIIGAAKRANVLCQQMLAYSGKGRFALKTMDLRDAMRTLAATIAIPASSNVQLHTNFPESPLYLEGDEAQLGQVAINLIANALDAIGAAAGTITVSGYAQTIRTAEEGEKFLPEKLAEGDYVCFEVTDTGQGMDASTVERLFDPFFSTKFTGRGLGMAAVLGIVRGHKGGIQVESTPGNGATIRVMLPAVAGPAPLERTAAPPSLDVVPYSGKVLVVDDEQTVRTTARRMLMRAGFDSYMAADGLEGLEVFQQHRDEICCVLLDLTMPNMDGDEVIRRLSALGAGVPIILMSGYSEQEIRERFADAGVAGFLEKPFKVRTLQEAILKAIQGAVK